MTTKNFFLSLLLAAMMCVPFTVGAQVTIGDVAPPQSFSVLELISNNTMGLRLPQLTTAQRNALGIENLTGEPAVAAMGLQIFNTYTGCVETWNGDVWLQQCGPGGPFPPSHFDEDCRDNPELANCFAELRRFASTVRRLADVANPGNHTANAQSSTAAGVSFNMMPVTGGVFYMGAQNTDVNLPNFDPSFSRPVTQVGVSSFFMGETEVTRELFSAVMRFSGVVGGTTLVDVWVDRNDPSAPDGFGIGNLAQNNVSWYDAIVFMNRLSVITGRDPVYSGRGAASDLLNVAVRPLGASASSDWVVTITQDLSANGFRLPTNAEWEYAARGGQRNEYTRTLGASGEQFRFSGSNNVDLVAWHRDHPNTAFGTEVRPVGLLAPNDLGLFDMSGNVTEWVWDWLGTRPACCVIDYEGPVSFGITITRSVRSGSGIADNMRVTWWMGRGISDIGNSMGFRIAASAQ